MFNSSNSTNSHSCLLKVFLAKHRILGYRHIVQQKFMEWGLVRLNLGRNVRNILFLTHFFVGQNLLKITKKIMCLTHTSQFSEYLS